MPRRNRKVAPISLPELSLAIPRLRKCSRKRSLALHEFALGLEALDRFVNKASLPLVHRGVFGILASEKAPAAPRLQCNTGSAG